MDMRTSLEGCRRCGGDRGASLVEYSMLLTVVAIICFGVVSLLGLPTGLVFENARDGFEISRTTAEGPLEEVTPVEVGEGPGDVTDCSTTTTVLGEPDPECSTTTTAGP